MTVEVRTPVLCASLAVLERGHKWSIACTFWTAPSQRFPPLKTGHLRAKLSQPFWTAQLLCDSLSFSRLQRT
jgi:hypothetical protein